MYLNCIQNGLVLFHKYKQVKLNNILILDRLINKV